MAREGKNVGIQKIDTQAMLVKKKRAAHITRAFRRVSGGHREACGQNTMASIPRSIRVAAPVAWATLRAAWAASMVGAIALATFFTSANLFVGAYQVAAGRMNILELPFIPPGGAFIFLLSLVFSFAITVPVSFVIAICAFPFLCTLQAGGERAFAVIGFVVGVFVWSGIWWNASAGNIYFGSWISSLIVGGSAGCAGGLAFARHLPQQR